MRQYLFQVPFTEHLLPGGWWLPGYGAMLLLAFLIVVWWGGRRALQVGLPKPKLQDMAMVLFISGIIGARILYMVQFPEQFKTDNLYNILIGFISIWKGGLVVYGAVFGGFIGYLFFRWFVLRRLKINGWQLADVVAPLLAIGMAVGRIGCYLNGCCWGQVAVVECQPVPLGADFGQFPLLPAHCRTQLCLPPRPDSRLPQIHGLQTSAGFTLKSRDPAGFTDPRTIDAVEPNSQAEQAGLKPGDIIVQANGQPNSIRLFVYGQNLKSVADMLGPAVVEFDQDQLRAEFNEVENFRTAKAKLAALPVTTTVSDKLWTLVEDWPKGDASLHLIVKREGREIALDFTPRTVTLFPTQIYETVSMLLLTFLLVAFQPFRRHDGQVMVLLMIGYAAHRFLNEAIRIEPTYALGLTLSQWISVFIFLAGVGLEIFLRKTQLRLPPGPLPLGYRT